MPEDNTNIEEWFFQQISYSDSEKDLEYFEKLKTKDLKRVIEPAVSKRSKRATFFKARGLMDGIYGYKKNEKTTIIILKALCAEEYPPAFQLLGYCYQYGVGVRKM